jgi:hypothetical protein
MITCPPAIGGVACPVFIARCPRKGVHDGDCAPQFLQPCPDSAGLCAQAEQQNCTFNPACQGGAANAEDHADADLGEFIIVGDDDWVPLGG